MNKFADWLNAEIESRGWSYRELGRRAGLSGTAIGDVISLKAKPGWNFCASIAQAFAMPPEKVFRLARLLPPLPGPEDDAVLKEISEVACQLDPDRRRDALEYIRWRYRQQQEKHN